MGAKELFTFNEVKQYLKINRSTLYKFVQQGKIPAVKVGRQWRFDLTEIDIWLKQKRLSYKETKQRQLEEIKIEREGSLRKTLEKRKFFRLIKKFPVKLSLIENEKEMYKATGINISEGGIFIILETPEQKFFSFRECKNRRINLIMELSEEDRLNVLSEIVWFSEDLLSSNKIGMGLKFFGITQEISSKISSYILKYTMSLNGTPELPLNFPMRIESSVVIKKNLEDVYNLLKDMEKFPEFIDDINSVEIIKEIDGKIISEWNVNIGDLSVSWRQLDIFDKHRAAIRFKMVDGDFESFTGEWSLQKLPTGTELKLTVIIDWGMPNLARHTEPILRKKIEDYIQNILAGIKAKLWIKKASVLAKFACIIHPLNIDLVTYFEPNLKYKKEAMIKKTFEWTTPFKCSYVTGIKSKTGKEITGELIGCTLLPEQILSLDNTFVLNRIIEAGKLAEKRGARIFGLAAYAAGVGRKGILVQRALNIPVTTGTNYTIAVTIEGVLEAAKKIGIDLSSANVSIVGATGSIGRICAQFFSTKVKLLTLIARNEVRLNELASLLNFAGKAKLNVSTKIGEFISKSDIIITATSTPNTLINTEILQPGTVVCDISLPKNVSEEDALKRKDILVIDGGLVKPPGNVDFHFYYGLPPQLTYACMAETMILTLEERFESYSLGGNVSFEKVSEIEKLGKKHGFKLASLHSFDKEIDEHRIIEVRKAYIKRRGIKK